LSARTGKVVEVGCAAQLRWMGYTLIKGNKTETANSLSD
jgi:hypothetical protein